MGNTYTIQAKEVGGANATATLYGKLRDYSLSGATVTLNGQTVAPYNTPNFIFFGDDTTSARASFTLSDIAIGNGKTAIALNLAENSANGAIVGSVNATDINANILTYSITSGNLNGTFAINPTNGQITVANSAALDFETTPSFNFTVGVSDGQLTDSAIVTVNLTNVNEAPVINTAIAPQGVNSNSVFNFTVPNSIFSDPEGDTLTYSASSLPSWLSFNPTTRTFNGTAPSTLGINSVAVSVDDSNGHSVSTNFDVIVKAGTTVVTGSGVIDLSNITGSTNITGSSNPDTIQGGSGVDTIQGGAGNDSIFGNAGNDRLFGEDGDDILYGGLGNDNLYGGAGIDTFMLEVGKGFDIVNDFTDGVDKFGLPSGVLTFGIGAPATDVTIAAFGTGTKIFAPSALGGAELMRILRVSSSFIDSSDFVTI